MVNAMQGVAAYVQSASGAATATTHTATSQVGAPPSGSNGFDQTMVEAIGDVEVQHAEADSTLAQLASGEQVDLHGTMIELEKADIALRTMVSVRDRFISAYEQVMNMTV